MNRRNAFISIIILGIVIYTFVASHVYGLFSPAYIRNIWSGVSHESTDSLTGLMERSQNALSELMDHSQSTLLEQLPYKDAMVELSGNLLKAVGMRSYYSSTVGINVTGDRYIIGTYAETSTDYEVSQMISFRDYLESRDIQLLYVNEPAKYTDDEITIREFGKASYLNSNMDLFLQRIEEAGIQYVDLRENISEENLDCKELFYRTDHHWTVPASKWAAGIIADRLNSTFGYHIRTDLYDDAMYLSKTWENAWLGEQGMKLAQSYIGLDDYTMLEPAFDTDYKIYDGSGQLVKEGDFSTVFINQTLYENYGKNPYQSDSWHYSYNGWSGCKIVNENAAEGKILVLGDSYESSMLPFLSLGAHEVSLVIPRDLKDTSVRDIIDTGEYDTVILAYAQFMLGAHDQEGNANQNMFRLE